MLQWQPRARSKQMVSWVYQVDVLGVSRGQLVRLSVLPYRTTYPWPGARLHSSVIVGCCAKSCYCLPTPAAAAILLAWRAGFEVHEEVKPKLDSGPHAWKGNKPCSDAWWGIGCGKIDGVDRVTNM
jgi:hypothetical protein